jgi:hypothetical protein
MKKKKKSPWPSTNRFHFNDIFSYVTYYMTKKNILGHKKYESILRHVIPSQSTFPAANLENIPLSSAREKGPKRYGPLTAIARVASSHPTPNPSALHLQRRSCTGLGPKPSARSLARDAPFPVVQQWPFF